MLSYFAGSEHVREVYLWVVASVTCKSDHYRVTLFTRCIPPDQFPLDGKSSASFKIREIGICIFVIHFSVHYMCKPVEDHCLCISRSLPVSPWPPVLPYSTLWDKLIHARRNQGVQQKDETLCRSSSECCQLEHLSSTRSDFCKTKEIRYNSAMSKDQYRMLQGEEPSPQRACPK